MLWDKNKKSLRNCLQRLVVENKEAIFGGDDPSLRILQLLISGPVNRVDDRHHRVLRVRYEKGHCTYTKNIWLKFRKDFERLYTIQRDLYERLQSGCKIFPAPYFYGHLEETGTSLIGMEYVEGSSLRNVLLRRLACRKGESLGSLFVRIGAGMRNFHDLSRVSGVKRVGEIADNARNVVTRSHYLADVERIEVIRQIGVAERQANSGTTLELIRTHNDWILRNIMVDKSHKFHIVDLDSMRARENSRWYDLCYFMINVESQIKYWPVIDRTGLSEVWKNVWQGYSGKGFPDRLSKNQIMAIIYLIKVEYLFGGTIRPPVFEIYNKFLGYRYLRRLKRSVMQGQYSTVVYDL